MRLALKADGERREEGTNEEQNEQSARGNAEELKTGKEVKMGLRESSNERIKKGWRHAEPIPAPTMLRGVA